MFSFKKSSIHCLFYSTETESELLQYSVALKFNAVISRASYKHMNTMKLPQIQLRICITISSNSFVFQDTNFLFKKIFRINKSLQLYFGDRQLSTVYHTSPRTLCSNFTLILVKIVVLLNAKSVVLSDHPESLVTAGISFFQGSTLKS